MPLEQERPTGVQGLHLEIDESLVHGGLVVADGIRYEEMGGATRRAGRKRIYWSGARAQFVGGPPRGHLAIMDPGLYRAPGSIPDPDVVRHVYKAGGNVWINSTLLGSMEQDARCRMLEYDNKVLIADGASPPVLVRRKIDDEQVDGAVMQYEMVPMGIRFPTTNDKVLLSSAGGGSINPSVDPFTSQQIYRVRLTIKDKYGRQSNPSIVSADLKIGHGSQDRTIVCDWTGFTLPAETVEVELWIQMNVYGITSSFVRIPELAGTGKFELADAGYTGTFTLANLDGADTWPSLEASHGFDHGHPPRLIDMAIVNGKIVGITSEDVVYREVRGEGQYVSMPGTRRFERNPDQSSGQGMRNDRVPIPPGVRFESEGAEIKPVTVDRSRVFVGKVYSPDYMEDFFTLGGGDERGVGVVGMGDVAFVFTTRTVWAVDPIAVTAKPTFSEIGADADATDSIVKTRDGIQFLGTDGSFYLFDGARSHPVGNPIVPLFRRDDYEGYYRRFDRSRAREVRGAYSRERSYFLMPTKGPLGETTDEMALVVADDTWSKGGSPLYSIDIESPYLLLSVVDEEGPLIAVDREGYLFAIEEGLVDEGQVDGELGVGCYLRWKKMVGNRYQTAIWRSFAIDLDPRGQQLTATIEVDNDPGLAISFLLPATRGRTRFGPKNLPATFRGRMATCSLGGTSLTERPTVYGLDIDSRPMGEF